jgi:hypothetical protein
MTRKVVVAVGLRWRRCGKGVGDDGSAMTDAGRGGRVVAVSNTFRMSTGMYICFGLRIRSGVGVFVVACSGGIGCVNHPYTTRPEEYGVFSYAPDATLPEYPIPSKLSTGLLLLRPTGLV